MPVVAAAPRAQPGWVGAETLNSADTASMMILTALVLLMDAAAHGAVLGRHGALGQFLSGIGRLRFSGLGYLKDTQKAAVSHSASDIPESVYAML